MPAILTDLLADCARVKLADYMAQIARCAALLSHEQLWRRANAHCNSVGNLLLHLRGNVAQWILGGIGGRPVDRDRPAEFASRTPLPGGELVRGLQETVAAARQLIGAIPPARWAEDIVIQGYRTSVLAAVFHVVEHFAFHAGQIVVMTKAMLDVDLSLYDPQGRRLDGRNAGAP